MCGIYCSISRHSHSTLSESVSAALKQRGPDSIHQHDLTVDGVYLTFVSSVLSLRGSSIVSQPLVDNATGSVLCWNGEAWNIDSEPVNGNDSELVFALFLKASAGAKDSQFQLLKTLENIRGPFALVYYDAQSQRLYYGRDCLGRRSLVKTTLGDGTVVISSICDLTMDAKWAEVEADGVYVTPISQESLPNSGSDSFSVHHIPHSNRSNDFGDGEYITLPYPKLNMTLPNNVTPLTLESSCVAQLDDLLLKSVTLRVQHIPGEPSSPLAILFSGGLDCTLLAYISHLVLPLSTSFDLLNVAFQNPRVHKDAVADPYSLCPDRVTGLSAFSTLKRLCPDRVIRLVLINIPYSETCAHRQAILSLMHPHNTEMDLSIASALYFASRGTGILHSSSSDPMLYSTPSRVLLSGLGADELFGGYSRHAIAFGRKGYSSLLDELALDFSRLGKRNLGRDDRITSHWSREVRYPYLDEDLVAWAVAAPGWEKCGFGMEWDDAARENDVGLEGGKLILRLLAWKYGMEDVAREKKRAIQFGSRTAKMHTGKSKGTDELLPGDS